MTDQDVSLGLASFRRSASWGAARKTKIRWEEFAHRRSFASSRRALFIFLRAVLRAVFRAASQLTERLEEATLWLTNFRARMGWPYIWRGSTVITLKFHKSGVETSRQVCKSQNFLYLTLYTVIITIFTIHRIFLLAHDWSKGVTWLNILQLKLREFPSDILQFS